MAWGRGGIEGEEKGSDESWRGYRSLESRQGHVMVAIWGGPSRDASFPPYGLLSNALYPAGLQLIPAY